MSAGVRTRTERSACPPVCWWAFAYVSGVGVGGAAAVTLARGAPDGMAARLGSAPGWVSLGIGIAALLVGASAVRRRVGLRGSAWSGRPGMSALACLLALASGVLGGAGASRRALEEGSRLAREPGVRLGRVSADPRPGRFGIDVTVAIDGSPARVRLCVAGGTGAKAARPLALGDRVSWVGALKPLDPGLDRDRASLLDGVAARGTVEVGLLGVRRGGGAAGRLLAWRHRVLARWLDGGRPNAARALVAAMVLGYRPAVDEVTIGAFRRSGLAHLLAVSGTHAGVVAAMLGLVAAVLGGGVRARRSAAVMGLVGYSVVTGMQPSVLRVTLALGLAYVAWLAGRRTAPLALIGLAAAALAAVWPGMVFSAGYRLSFAAAAGLVVWGRPLADRLRRRIPPRAADALAATTAAQLAVTPLLAADFAQISAVAPLANLAALPLVGPLLGSGLVAALAEGAGGPTRALLAPVALRAADMCAEYVSAVAGWWAAWPGAAVPAWGLPLLVWPLYYAATDVLIHGPCGVSRPDTSPEGDRRIRGRVATGGGARVAIAAAAFLAMAAWSAWPFGAAGSARPGLEMRVLDVGQGDAILLRTAGGATVLVDGGPSGSLLKRRLAEARVGVLDLVVVTHAHTDHYVGVASAVCDLSVRELWRSPGDGDEPGYARLLAAARRRSVRLRAPPAGTTARIDPWLRLEVLWPPDGGASTGLSVNDQSLVLMATSGSRRILLSGDITERAQTLLATEGERLRCDVYKVAHHGSAGSLDPTFLDLLGARVAVVSVGTKNRYGHPSPSALAELGGRGMRVLRTDRLGTIIVFGDGRRLRLRHARPAGMSVRSAMLTQ